MRRPTLQLTMAGSMKGDIVVQQSETAAMT
jgi:hypothetical protein